MVDTIWLTSAMWIGLALAASLISMRLALSVALVEFMVGALGSNIIRTPLTPWIDYLASFKAKAVAKRKGIKLDANVVVGHAADAVVADVTAKRADLLIVGFMGHSALYERTIGGADRLVRLAPCPVLVVK